MLFFLYKHYGAMRIYKSYYKLCLTSINSHIVCKNNLHSFEAQEQQDYTLELLIAFVYSLNRISRIELELYSCATNVEVDSVYINSCIHYWSIKMQIKCANVFNYSATMAIKNCTYAVHIFG